MLFLFTFQPIFIHELNVTKGTTENCENGTDINRVLKINDKLINMLVLAPTANECNLWMKKVDEAKSSFNNSKMMHQKIKGSKLLM